MLPTSWYAVLALHTASTFAYTPCALLGPGYPAPVDISSNNSVGSAAWSNLTALLDSFVSGKQLIPGLDVAAHTFSISAYSARDAAAQEALQYHHTGASLRNSSVGVQKVDGDSIYRIGSVSKLLTTYLTLATIGSGFWEEPVTKFVPELAAATYARPADAVNSVDWNKVTLGSLAGQISGLGRDPANFLNEVAISLAGKGINPTILGLPALNASDPLQLPSCEFNTNSTCSREQWLLEMVNRAPVAAPWTEPIYSNAAYGVLAFALEGITNMSFPSLLQDNLFTPLGMYSSSYTVPTDLSHAVIPGGNAIATGFGLDLGPDTPDGGYFSTLNDMSAMGVSILNSTLMCPQETRQWLKPISHTSNPNVSVGRPWEILRFTQPVTGRVNDLYTKEGDVGNYSSYLILSPDHDAGFAVLASGPSTDALVEAVGDALSMTMIPGFEAQAAAEAAANFGGKYASNASGANSSMSLTADASSGPGLVVEQWTSNGTDMLATLSSLRGIKEMDMRLYPMGLEGDGQMSFRAVFGDKSAEPQTGLFSKATQCETWITVDLVSYGEMGLDWFVFDVDGSGKATGVSPKLLRTTLTRQ